VVERRQPWAYAVCKVQRVIGDRARAGQRDDLLEPYTLPIRCGTSTAFSFVLMVSMSLSGCMLKRYIINENGAICFSLMYMRPANNACMRIVQVLRARYSLFPSDNLLFHSPARCGPLQDCEGMRLRTKSIALEDSETVGAKRAVRDEAKVLCAQASKRQYHACSGCMMWLTGRAAKQLAGHQICTCGHTAGGVEIDFPLSHPIMSTN
jgi:hypothetical protein